MTPSHPGFGWPAKAEAAEPASPCVRRCTLDEEDLCVGCGRLLSEILSWAAAPTPRKIEIRAAAAARLEARRRRFRPDPTLS